MSEVPPLNIKINLDASGVNAGVAKATQGLEQVSARSKSIIGTMGSLKTTMLGVFGGTLLTQGVFALGRELNHMKQEAIDIQSSTQRLNTALGDLGITSKSTQQAIFQNADAYYQLGFQGSEALNAMGTLVTATGDVTQANKLMAMSADLARYKHIDMNTAATILARGTQGSAKAFKEMGITLDTTIPKNQAIAKAFDELNAKIGGQAQAYTKTFAGQMAILRERFDNIAQSIGAVVLPVLTKLATMFAGVFKWISQNSGALQVLAGIVLVVTAALKGAAIVMAIIQGINPFTYVILGAIATAVIFVKLWNTFDWFRKGVSTGLAALVKEFGYIMGGIARIIRYLSYIPGFGFLKGVADNADKAAVAVGKLGDKIIETGKKQIKPPSMPKIVGGVVPGGKTGITGNIVGGDTTGGKGGGGGSQTVQYITVYASNTNDIEKKMAMAARAGVPVGGK